MLRIKDIQKALRPLVGWEDEFGENLSGSLTASESGLYFQGANPLITLTNMKGVMPDLTGKIKEWESEKAYNVGDIVSYASKTYIAVVANVDEQPDTGNSWDEYDAFSAWLEKLTDNGIATAVQTFIQMKQLNKSARSLLERRPFFEGAGRLANMVENKGRIVGYEIDLKRSMGISAKIERIGLQMAGETGIVKLYLFHSSQPEPMKVFEFDFTKANGGFQWFDVADVFMPYAPNNANVGGTWYLCYCQSELPPLMHAISTTKDWSREPCGTCGVGNIRAWRELMQYMEITPFWVETPTEFAENPMLWDVSRNVYVNSQNYGLNVEVSVGCDLTDFIIAQRHIFATVVQRQVAMVALRTLALNPNVRVNRNQLNVTQSDILYEIDGDTRGRDSGLGYQLRKAYDALELDTRDIDPICLPCKGKGVKYQAI